LICSCAKSRTTKKKYLRPGIDKEICGGWESTWKMAVKTAWKVPWEEHEKWLQKNAAWPIKIHKKPSIIPAIITTDIRMPFRYNQFVN